MGKTERYIDNTIAMTNASCSTIIRRPTTELQTRNDGDIFRYN